jgi:hypothetical protein
MLFLSFGFALIITRAVIVGAVFEFLGFDIFGGFTVELILNALGFMSAIPSIYIART